MKKENLKNTSYHYLVQAFAEWLDVLGYAKMTTYNLPRLIKQFLHYLEINKLNKINQIQNKHVNQYQEYLKTQISQKTQKALSGDYINQHYWAIEKFFNFLYHKGVQNLPDVNLKYLKTETATREILTEQEIKELYEIAKTQEYINAKQEAINYQDVVLLSIYYACGLRRSEGVALEITDVNLDTKILHVKKGKGGKQRLIPFNKATAKHLQNWIYQYRDVVIEDKKISTLFLNYIGTKATGNTLNRRLQGIIQQSENTILKQKRLSLHNLRHSIATHLLANGMDIQKVQQFLGHTSLGTTEIYTHLIEEIEENKQKK